MRGTLYASDLQFVARHAELDDDRVRLASMSPRADALDPELQVALRVAARQRRCAAVIRRRPIICR
jgi:hypothetical protein